MHQSINECASNFAKPHYFFALVLVGLYIYSFFFLLLSVGFGVQLIAMLLPRVFFFSENTLRADCFIYLCNIHFGPNCHASRIAHTVIIGNINNFVHVSHPCTLTRSLSCSFIAASCYSIAFDRVFLCPIEWTDSFFFFCSFNNAFRSVCHCAHHFSSYNRFGTVRDDI